MRCTQCSTAISTAIARVCDGACRAVPYCSVDCQTRHWKAVHSAECAEIARLLQKLYGTVGDDDSSSSMSAHASRGRVGPPENAVYVLAADAYIVEDIAKRLTPHEVRTLARAMVGTPLFGVLTNQLLWRMFFNRDFGQSAGDENNRPAIENYAAAYWQHYAAWLQSGQRTRWDAERYRELGRRSLRNELPDASIANDLYRDAVWVAAGRGQRNEVLRLVEQGTHALTVHHDDGPRRPISAALCYGASAETALLCLMAEPSTVLKAQFVKLIENGTYNYATPHLLESVHAEELRMFSAIFAHAKFAAVKHQYGRHEAALIAGWLFKRRGVVPLLQAAIRAPDFSAAETYAVRNNNTVPLLVAGGWNAQPGASAVLRELIARNDFEPTRATENGYTVDLYVALRWSPSPASADVLLAMVQHPHYVQTLRTFHVAGDVNHAVAAPRVTSTAHVVAHLWSPSPAGLRVLGALVQRPDFAANLLDGSRRSVASLMAQEWAPKAPEGAAALLLAILERGYAYGTAERYDGSAAVSARLKAIFSIVSYWPREHGAEQLVGFVRRYVAENSDFELSLADSANWPLDALLARHWVNAPGGAAALRAFIRHARFNDGKVMKMHAHRSRHAAAAAADDDEPDPEMLPGDETLPEKGLRAHLSHLVAAQWVVDPHGLELLTLLVDHASFHALRVDSYKRTVPNYIADRWYRRRGAGAVLYAAAQKMLLYAEAGGTVISSVVLSIARLWPVYEDDDDDDGSIDYAATTLLLLLRDGRFVAHSFDRVARHIVRRWLNRHPFAPKMFSSAIKHASREQLAAQQHAFVAIDIEDEDEQLSVRELIDRAPDPPEHIADQRPAARAALDARLSAAAAAE